ncbi:MAG TPA: TadE/TadG family type IV pilus assembly protein, partial [Acidimicrobiales bacterium]
MIAEAALVTPLFILLLFGALEFGGAFRDYLTLSNGSLAGTRMAAIQGNAADADWNLVQAVKKSMNAMPLYQIQKVVVYRLSPVAASNPPAGQCQTGTCPTSSVPASCLTAIQGVAGVCNVYGPTELAVVSA